PLAGRSGVTQPVNKEPLNKRLSAHVSGLCRASVISGLTAPQGFVFSLFPCALDLKFLEGRDWRAGGISGRKRHWNQCCWRRSAGYRMHGLFRWSSKWWPGLIPLAALWAIAAWTNTEPLEADLGARSAAALKDIVLDKTRITVAGRDVSLAADAFSEE